MNRLPRFWETTGPERTKYTDVIPPRISYIYENLFNRFYSFGLKRPSVVEIKDQSKFGYLGFWNWQRSYIEDMVKF